MTDQPVETGRATSTATAQTGRESPSGRDSLGYQLNFVARSARWGFERRLRANGASFATWTVLEMLTVRGPMIQGELAEVLGVRGPTATRVLDRMNTDGLVRRSPVPEDRRKTEVGLTHEGERLHERLTGIVEDANAELVSGFSSNEVATLRALLDRLQGNVAQEPASQRG